MTIIKLFYSTDCVHCIKFKPIWDEMKEIFDKHNIKYFEYLVGENNEEFDKEKIVGYPTLIIIKNGKKYKFAGDRTKENIFRELGINNIKFDDKEIEIINEKIKNMIEGGNLPKNSIKKFHRIINKYK